MESFSDYCQIEIWSNQSHDQLPILGTLQILLCLLKGLRGVVQRRCSYLNPAFSNHQTDLSRSEMRWSK